MDGQARKLGLVFVVTPPAVCRERWPHSPPTLHPSLARLHPQVKIVCSLAWVIRHRGGKAAASRAVRAVNSSGRRGRKRAGPVVAAGRLVPGALVKVEVVGHSKALADQQPFQPAFVGQGCQLKGLARRCHGNNRLPYQPFGGCARRQRAANHQRPQGPVRQRAGHGVRRRCVEGDKSPHPRTLAGQRPHHSARLPQQTGHILQPTGQKTVPVLLPQTADGGQIGGGSWADGQAVSSV